MPIFGCSWLVDKSPLRLAGRPKSPRAAIVPSETFRWRLVAKRDSADGEPYNPKLSETATPQMEKSQRIDAKSMKDDLCSRVHYFPLATFPAQFTLFFSKFSNRVKEFSR